MLMTREPGDPKLNSKIRVKSKLIWKAKKNRVYSFRLKSGRAGSKDL